MPPDHQILSTLTEMREEHRSDLAEIKLGQRRIKELIDGGSEPESGLLWRVKSAERDLADIKATKKSIGKAAWVAAGGALSAAGAALWGRLAGGSH